PRTFERCWLGLPGLLVFEGQLAMNTDDHPSHLAIVGDGHLWRERVAPNGVLRDFEVSANIRRTCSRVFSVTLPRPASKNFSAIPDASKSALPVRWAFRASSCPAMIAASSFELCPPADASRSKRTNVGPIDRSPSSEYGWFPATQRSTRASCPRDSANAPTSESTRTPRVVEPPASAVQQE